MFTASCLNASSGNSANMKQFADLVSGQHTLSSRVSTSTDAVPEHGTSSSHPHDRWRTQMAFSKTVYSFEVKEDTAPGTVVGKVEAVFKSLTPITYSVQEDDGDNLFLLVPLSGEFLLSRRLDFEAQRFYILTVAAQQRDSQVSSVRVYFNVMDVNDNPPVFSRGTFSVSLTEGAKVGTCFLSLNVSDKDDGDNGDFKLRVVSGDDRTAFFLNSAGSLCLNTELDRETQSLYNLTVTANDCAQPESAQFTSTARVTVEVHDINDNAPLFKSAEILNIPEDAALHSVVMAVHAEDADSGSNGEVLYYLNNTLGLFSIDNRSGKIYLEEELDREQVDTLTITVTAADNGSPRMATTISLTVHIVDVNDNDPEFIQSNYSLTVREDIRRGTSLLQVQAFDQDTGKNGQVRYRLTHESPFVVDSVRGVITVMDDLDREMHPNYNLIITAEDQGDKPRSSTAAVSVTVMDVNDFVPKFTPETLTIHITEDEEDHSHLTHQVSAVDEDLGINSQLTYSIAQGNTDGLFSITPNGTFQILRSLDREEESSYFVTIIAVDSGLPSLTGTLTVHIIVDDINDNRPEFTEDIYNTIVSEDSPTGTVFAMITASDIDEGVNGEIRYSLQNFDVPFSIDETSGELFTTSVLDRETVAIYSLVVIGRDKHPSEPLSSSVLVSVLIGDVNDHWPQFMNSPYVAYVPTQMAPGSVVCAVKATDGDSEMNAELHYSLYGQSSDLFSIHPYSGTVFTSVFSLRRTEDIIVSVHVEDAGENPKFDITTISIRFQNVSQFPEMKVDVLSYHLSEDEPVGTLVAVVSAASTRAEPVSFYLASGNFEDMFHVDQLSGALTVENPLDYESKKEFTLLIEARDSGSAPFSSFEEIHINISDVNDNFPQFTQEEYRCEVFENSPPSWVCDVLAIDADSGGYGTVQYNITDGNTDNFFTVDSETGILSTTVSLDRETIPEFNLTVEASELNNPRHKDRASVIVVVLDRNDNAPRFSQIFLTVVPEDSPVGHTVIQVTSMDDDTDTNAGINYSIINQSEDIPFDIDFTDGFITVKRPLDREMQDRFVLRVNANDSAWSVSTDITVIIADVNDNKPEFTDQSYAVILPETTDIEVFVMQVVAADADLFKNSEILYVIEPPSDEFWVNASSGEIFTKQPLRIKSLSFDIYHFTVIAFDCGDVPLYSDTTVTVRLEPHNYHPPTFLPIRPLIAVPYHMAVGTEVVQFTAVDQDLNNSSEGIRYVSNGGNASDFFWIQAGNGKVMLNQSLSQSENVFLSLIVTAVDQGHPSLSSQTEITFEITGRNLFPPSFTKPEAVFSVPEDLSVGSVIGRIHAGDRDYGSNGAIMYSINLENPLLPFSVGETSGLLSLIRGLDFEEEGFYHFQIEAVDGGWVSQTGTVNVTVVVMDVNDNPPVFSSSEYSLSVPENTETGTTILEVKAADDDSGVNAQVVYSLIAGHVDKFSVDSGNGAITTLTRFDYEQEQNFEVTIKASNVGARSLFSLAHVVIQILDINEFRPTFTETDFNISVLKNVPVGTVIGRVTATDDDQGPEGEVFYLMFGQNKNMGFEINERSGEIFTTRSLRKQRNSNVDLKVLAKNSGVITGANEDETLVHIAVVDLNEAPMFSSVLYSANVSEDSQVGTSVITVSALDPDSILGLNRVVFSIESGNTNLSFAVDPSSGVISVNSLLDREEWPLYNLTLTAADNGSPPATGTANIMVTVGDVNDNAPTLMFTEAYVEENQPQGTIVARLNASDPDSPPNQGPFTYWLVNPPTDGALYLNPNGVLVTAETTDREQVPLYRVLVAVSDAGNPRQSSTAMFNIKIIDENDNPPLPRNIFIEVKYFGGSFQGGMIGNVHPEDPDESDSFICAIRSGSHNMFTISNGTCELWSAPFQGEATFNITVEATDQLHFPVNNSIFVNYKGFTNASIDSCILFYMSSFSMEEFVSNNYLRFVKALDSLFNLQASKTHVFGIKQIGGEILLLAAVKNYNGRYLSKEVASGISAGHKRLLEVQSNVTISHITSDPCLTSPCQNGATCKKSIFISQDVAVLESDAVIFVSPQKEVFNCTCPAGFAGTLCEADVDECEVNPCENEGTCVNTAGSFYCHCQKGFTGPVCSADVDQCLRVKCQNGGTCVPTKDGYYCLCVPGFEGEKCEQLMDHCKSTPCVQGNCTNLQNGFFCRCPFGVSGVHCEKHSYGFEELSFMEFPPLDRRINLISLEFATVQRDSLLLYNPGGSSSREFFALEILNGSIHLSYDLGSGPMRLQTNKQVADGYFHSVTARRIGNMGSLNVDNCTDVENNGFCFSQSMGSNSARTLDVSSNMTFGGLRTVETILLQPGQIKTHDFVGCIRNIYVNGILLRPSVALASFNILDRCPRVTPSPCLSSPCNNGGTCHDLWSNFLCECRSSFTGNTCAKEMSEGLVLHFNGNEYIEYVIKERFKRDYLLKDLLDDKKGGNMEEQSLINITFKTQDDGVLISVKGQTGYTELKIKDRKPVCIFEDTPSGLLKEFTVDSVVADGVWHVFSLFSVGRNIFLTLDGSLVLNVTDGRMDLTPATVEKIVLGGALIEDSTLQQSGFIGCVRYFNVSGHPLPASGHSVMVDVWPSLSLLQPNCSSQGVCLPSPCPEENTAKKDCLSADCQERWRCRPAVQNRSCICFHNVSNHTCDICASTSESRDGCSEAQHSGPLWIIAVVLPLISILALTVMVAALYKARQKNAKRENENTTFKTEQGADNRGFCFHEKTTTPTDKVTHVPMRADQQRLSMEFYCDASLSSLQPEPQSEPEYYEIGSISSASHSETASLKLGFHNHVDSKKCAKAEPRQWGDLRMFLAGFKKEYSSEERDKSETRHRTMASSNKQVLAEVNAENSQDLPPCHKTKFLQSEYLEPVQCLTFEEISKLNNPLQQRISLQASLRSSSMMEESSESDTDSTFTGAEFDCGQFAFVCDGDFTHERSSLNGNCFRKRGILTLNSLSELDTHSAACQHDTESGLCTLFEQWEKSLNLHLPLSSYAPVFEDIARLPTEPGPSFDMQSDIEEII
ncbi:protocadherin Fat 4 isoform X1 [Xyrichtys novacula]|uniref:Protocadherin Fat 4 isoform X1 n=1 Tax=Xyrichtys novacula TaxID=13765 RepID=A0AAV1FX25_XYRNO|nr:protocadherin Fat 4 isoform X1 [Xyrichtys novacula]